jgi:UDP-2,4-diacetamido-2,4,6-trideoxy-beta-L-altropyranose hydrolase
MSAPILIRADASRQIGLGHVMRTLALADALAQRGFAPHYVSRHIIEALAERIGERGYPITRLPHAPAEARPDEYGAWLGTSETADAKAFCQIVDFCHPAVVVVDHYGLGVGWERTVRSHSGAILLAYDDLQRVHDADIILDMTAGCSAEDYAGLIRSDARLLGGPGFATLRPQFANQRKAAISRRLTDLSGDDPLHLLLSMGGADKDNITGKVVSALALLPDAPFSLDVVVGAGYEPVAELQAGLDRLVQPSQLHVNTRIMVELMSRADLAMGAAGSSSWERCTLGLPAIHAVIANNQQRIADALEQAGASYTISDPFGLPVDRLAHEFIAPTMADRLALTRMAKAAATLCDGEGANRVADLLEARRRAVA